MNNKQMLEWVGNLPKVRGSNWNAIMFGAMREEVVSLVEKAQALEAQAEAARADAYTAALRIESEAHHVWSAEEIAKAKSL
ncbi:stable inheritance protein KleA [Massilia sp. CCM 9210]|uniref:stable inheritance protein KleA n=1 Tax=Massilia scottii TaxID=3057166 RepID=UPI002796C69B|nr:stable inheritance protein KleA [Massilia sp. CCM 9210]MDQ1817813.1 stable inheritance protein KleA [Massilia sp. CCM 9210]